MSKTERDLAADGAADALEELFDDTDFDEALDAALEQADADVPTEDAEADDDVAPSDDPTAADAPDAADADTATDTDTDVTALEDGAVDDVEGTDAATDVDVDADSETAADAGPAAADTMTDADVEDDAADAVTDADVEDDAADAVTDADVGDDAADTATDADVEDDVDAASGSDDASDEYEFPEIVQATPDDVEDVDEVDEVDDAEAFVEEELDADEVAEEILEELRRADIDGPQVEMAPQDDTTAARRRPRRAVDYDPAPMPIPARVPRVLARKPRVRKVTRVVRHVDPWSVFKIALVANLVLYIIVLTAGVLLWNVAHATGTVDNVERFFESFGWQSFEFNGGEIYHAAWIAGLFAVIGLTGMAVLLATLFNLITDLVGGVRFTVLEEEVVETRTSPLRRFVVRRPEPDVPVKLTDHSGPMYREAVVDDTSANERPSR